MKPWNIEDLKLKHYPHFDAVLGKKKIAALIENPGRVSSHPFHPFLFFEEKFKPFRPSGKPIKIRPIRYACRADSYIYSRYRHKLATEYEELLKSSGLNESILAYRHIPTVEGGTKGKSNIEFAKEVFDTIREVGNCVVVTADISSYFDSIDHDKLKTMWGRLIGKAHLPPDHYAVFKSLTAYTDVDYKELCRELGFFGEKRTLWGKRDGYLLGKKEMPTQLCSNSEFREILRKRKLAKKPILNKNNKPYGIPQGAPMSDVLANSYLFDFDVKVLDYVKKRKGFYFRYSDDLLLIIPGAQKKIAKYAERFLIKEIEKTGSEIRIQPKKCASLIYKNKKAGQRFKSISKKPILKKNGKPKRFKSGKKKGKKQTTLKMRNGLEYLGFRYDGQKVYLRDKTVSNFYRKLKRNAWAEAFKTVTRYQDKNVNYLIDNYNYEDFLKRFGKVENFAESQSEDNNFKTWTFFTYVKRASKVFGKQGSPIRLQIRKFEAKARKDIKSKIVRVHTMRSKQES